MKTYLNRTFLYLLIVAISVAALSCSKEEDLTPREEVTALMTSGTWKIQNVSVDAVDKTSMFTGTTSAFTPTAFTTTNGGVVWPASGTWQFTSDDATSFKRNDDVIVTIVEITDSKFVVEFPWSKNTFAPGRVTSVSGRHIFTFVK